MFIYFIIWNWVNFRSRQLIPIYSQFQKVLFKHAVVTNLSSFINNFKKRISGLP